MRASITRTICGLYALVYKSIHASGGKKDNRIRRRKENKTNERQAAINQRNAADNLFLLIQGNFGGGDLHMILTYSQEHYPISTEKLKADHNNFIRRLKYAYAKLDIELKYIHVIEYKKSRPHHHYIINKAAGITVDIIQDEIWKQGLIRSTPLERGGYYRKLSDYLIKETSKTFNSSERIYGRRWTASRNLTQPKKETEAVKVSNEADFLDVPASDERIEVIKGSEFLGVNEFTGMPYLRYVIKMKPCGGSYSAVRRL